MKKSLFIFALSLTLSGIAQAADMLCAARLRFENKSEEVALEASKNEAQLSQYEAQLGNYVIKLSELSSPAHKESPTMLLQVKTVKYNTVLLNTHLPSANKALKESKIVTDLKVVDGNMTITCIEN